jgi:hypothetical protein
MATIDICQWPCGKSLSLKRRSRQRISSTRGVVDGDFTSPEDRVLEASRARLAGLTDSHLAGFVQSRLDDEIKRLHNPNAIKTLQLLNDYAGVDVLPHWKWNHVDPQTAKQRLDGYLNLRGDVVHRSRTLSKGLPPQPDPVTKDDLQKAIYFLKELVKATDRALSPE